MAHAQPPIGRGHYRTGNTQSEGFRSTMEEYMYRAPCGVTVFTFVGDINNIRDASAVVTGEGTEFQNESYITQALLASCPEFRSTRDKLKKKYRSSFHPWTVRTSKLKYSKYRYVFHAVTQRDEDWKDGMEKMYKKLFKKAEKYKVEVLILPLLGSGRAGGDVDEAVSAMIDSISSLKFQKYLEKIYLLTLEKENADKMATMCTFTFEKSSKPTLKRSKSLKEVFGCGGSKTQGNDNVRYGRAPTDKPSAHQGTHQQQESWGSLPRGFDRRQHVDVNSTDTEWGFQQNKDDDENHICRGSSSELSNQDKTQRQDRAFLGENSNRHKQHHSIKPTLHEGKHYTEGLPTERHPHDNDWKRGTPLQVFEQKSNQREDSRRGTQRDNAFDAEANKIIDNSANAHIQPSKTVHMDEVSDPDPSVAPFKQKSNQRGSWHIEKTREQDSLKEGFQAEPIKGKTMKHVVTLASSHVYTSTGRNHFVPEYGDTSYTSAAKSESKEAYMSKTSGIYEVTTNAEVTRDIKGPPKTSRKGRVFKPEPSPGIGNPVPDIPENERQGPREDKEGTAENEHDQSCSRNCPICISPITDPKWLKKCGHVFCKDCIDNSFKQFKPVCPSCNMVYGTITGNQPDGQMDVGFSGEHVPGYQGHGTITITYYFPSGVQSAEHPNPGQPYKGTTRRAYLPDNKEGKQVLKLLRTAFDRKLTFTIGRSTTTGQENVVTWNDIHHKTNIDGGPTRFGYPDQGYLTRVKDELASKGVTEEKTETTL